MPIPMIGMGLDAAGAVWPLYTLLLSASETQAGRGYVATLLLSALDRRRRSCQWDDFLEYEVGLHRGRFCGGWKFTGKNTAMCMAGIVPMWSTSLQSCSNRS